MCLIFSSGTSHLVVKAKQKQSTPGNVSNLLIGHVICTCCVVVHITTEMVGTVSSAFPSPLASCRARCHSHQRPRHCLHSPMIPPMSLDTLLHSPTGWAQLSTAQNCAHILARGALRRYQQLSPLDMVQLRVSAPHSVQMGLVSGEMISALGCSLHPTCDRANGTWPLIVLCNLSLDHGTRNCCTPDWHWVEMGNHRYGNWLQTVCNLRHEAGQPRNLYGISLST